MKILKSLLTILSLAMIAVSCNKKVIHPSADLSTETRSVSNFDRIVVSDAISVSLYMTTGEEYAVVTTNSNLQTYVKTEVKDGTLYLDVKDQILINGKHTVHVDLYAQDFQGLDLSGASTCTLDGVWEAVNASLNLSGASYFMGKINASSLALEFSGASSADMSGQAQGVGMDLSGASSLRNAQLECTSVTADLTGASNAEMTVHGTLKLNLSGGSTFRYTGNGVVQELNATGSSNVIHF